MTDEEKPAEEEEPPSGVLFRLTLEASAGEKVWLEQRRQERELLEEDVDDG